MKDYLIDFCTHRSCHECAYRYSRLRLYYCVILETLKVSYPWTWNENIELDDRKVAFLEGV